MVDDVAECSKGCLLYEGWRRLNFCKADKVYEDKDEPFCYNTAILEKPCRYRLSEEAIKEIKSALEEKVSE